MWAEIVLPQHFLEERSTHPQRQSFVRVRGTVALPRSYRAECVKLQTIMDVFELRRSLVQDYEQFTRSFVNVRDRRIAERIDQEFAQGAPLA